MQLFFLILVLTYTLDHFCCKLINTFLFFYLCMVKGVVVWTEKIKLIQIIVGHHKDQCHATWSTTFIVVFTHIVIGIGSV